MSKKSKTPETIGNPSSIANAMYDAQKKEINSSMALSGSFIASGVIVALLGIYKYLSVKNSVTDSGESIDAMAWIVIAGVGLLVGIIGLVSIMKSIVSLKQIGSWAEEAESHASPFQGQKLNRKVAAMNQSHSMQKPGMSGDAEADKPGKAKFGIFKRGRDKNKQNNEDLYYKYNPQEKPTSAKPEKSAPVMEQKFDYGIHEAKKLTFADEFLKKNKRDPFAQYRKDLGIEEETEQTFVQKPKFISNGTANNAAQFDNSKNQFGTIPSNNDHQMSLMEELNLGSDIGNELQFDSSLNNEEDHFEFSLSSKFDDTESTEESYLDFEEEQEKNEFDAASENDSIPMSFEQDSVSNSPYGSRNSADDDIFFSSKTVTPPPLPVSQQGVKPNLAAALDKAAPKAPTPSTVLLDLDYREKRPAEDYNFSLFEEIDPVKANKSKNQQNQQKKMQQPQQNKPIQQPVQQPVQQKPSANDDMFFGGSSAPTKKQEAPDTQQAFMSNFVNSIENQDEFMLRTQRSPQQVQIQQPAKQPVQQQKPSPPVQQNQSPKKPTSTPHKTRNTRFSKKKKSFSENYLNKNGKNAEGNSDIIKNGTRSQRKFVDASEYDEWSCPECGKVNQEYVGICACGARKPRAKNR